MWFKATAIAGGILGALFLYYLLQTQNLNEELGAAKEACSTAIAELRLQASRDAAEARRDAMAERDALEQLYRNRVAALREALEEERQRRVIVERDFRQALAQIKEPGAQKWLEQPLPSSISALD
tara:strand:- start:225 stop:599 length:375 start_codon:yes stop_codon:yes gene_type:complete